MANSDRDIVISPDRGSSTDPTIRFTGADSLSSATIVLRVYNSGTDATLSFEGDVGQLFSITDSTFGPIFSVNDITGIPSIEVLDTGEIRMAQYSGFVNVLGTTNATSTASGVLRVAGGVGIGRDTYIGGNLTVQGNVTAGSGTIFGTISTASSVTITNDNSNASAHYLTFVSGTSGNLPLKVDSNALSFVPSTNNLGLGTTTPYTRLSLVSSAATEGISLFTSPYESARQWGTRIWKNDTGGGIPLQIETQEATTWYNSIRIGHGQNSNHPSLTTFYETHLATTGGNVGINSTSPIRKLHSRITSSGAPLILENSAGGAGSFVDLEFSTYTVNQAGYANSPAAIRVIDDGAFSGHITFRTKGASIGAGQTERMRIEASTGNIGINTTDFSYTSSDNTAVVAGGIDANKVFVNGSIQLIGNNNAIVFGRGTSSFLKDEELGFGWGGGWYMTDGTYLRVRGNKHVYNEGIYSGLRYQPYTTSYNNPNLYLTQFGDTNWAFGSSSNDSNTFWMQAKYYGTNDNLRGFRVLDANSGVARMSVADRITTHQNTFYRTFQSYTGTENNPVKTWDGVLTAGSDSGGASAYTIIDTTVPQDSYMMGGFTIEWFENYYSTNGKTSIKLGGYWNPESNGGFLGWEYTTANPNITPTIYVARNSSTGNTAFILAHFSSNYAIVVARDLWLGYSGGDYNYGHGWTIKQQSDTSGYTNLDTVVARAAASATGLNADTLDSIDSSQFLRSDVSDSWAASNGPLLIYTPNGASGANTGQVNNLQVFQQNVNTDAFMSFHVSGDYAAHFGLDGTTNDLFYGGWSVGGVKHKVYHAGNTDLNLIREASATYKWSVSANGTQARRWNILRVYGTPNHWGGWQNIEIRLDGTYFHSGYAVYHLYGYYGQGNGNSWNLYLKDGSGVGTGYFRVSLGPVTYAGFTSGGQNTYYQDVFVDVDYYMSVNVTANFYGNTYQTATPGAESYTLTQLFTSPAVTNITYSNDDKSSSYLFSSKIWNAGNDGAGSGLDADLLDGLNGSDYWTKSGSWWGSGFNGSRLQGVAANGGEFTLIQDHPNTSQISVLIDGEYYAGENNGFMMVPGNDYSGRRGMRWNGSQIDFTVNNPQVLMSTLILPQNTVGQAHAGVSTQPSYYIGQQRGDNDAWKIYGESPAGTNTGALILQSEDDYDSNESIRLRFKRTYGAFETSDVLIANFDRVTTTSHRSNIYYDSDDTTYYLDPNSTSDSALRIRGGALFGPNTSWSSYLMVGGNGRQGYIDNTSVASVASTNGNLHMDAASGYEMYLNYYDGSSVYFGNGANGVVGRVASDGTARFPIFYDYNDTTYYLDPQGGGSLLRGRINVTGGHGSSSIRTYLASGENGAGTGQVTLQMWCSEPGNTWDGAGFGYNVDNNLNEGGNVPAYYFGRPNTSHGQAYMRMTTDGNWYFYNTPNGSNTRYTTMRLSNTGFIENYASIRSPIYYDYNDTAYYVDPNGTSRIGGIQISPAETTTTGNGIRFYGLAGDAAGAYNHAAIIERLWGSTDQSELLIFKGNDPDVSTIHDRIRIASTGRIVFHSYNGYATVDDYITAAGTGNINGSGFFNGNQFYVTGEITAYFSDRRLKTDIKPIENPLEKVKSLNGIIYKHNDLAKTFGYISENSIVGLFADEVEAVLPEAVKLAPFDDNHGESLSGENYKTVQYEKLIPLLVEAVKELTTKVESYEAKIAYLENKINKGNS